MNLVLTVAEIVAPVFLLGAVGFTWVKAGFEFRLQFVTQVAMSVSLPCLIFVSLMTSELEPSALTAVTLASVVAYGLVTALTLILVRVAGLDLRTYLAPLIFGNTGNLGLPLAFFAFGQEGFIYALVVFAVMAIYSFTAGIWMVSGGGSLLRVLKEPVVGGTLLGALFLWQGWRTPDFLTNTLQLAGQMAIPLMLLTLGVAVARLTPQKLGRALALSAAKLAICVGAAWGAGAWFGLTDLALSAMVLQVATPVAVTSYLLAEKYGADAESVAGLVVISTLLSVGYIPLLLGVLL